MSAPTSTAIASDQALDTRIQALDQAGLDMILGQGESRNAFDNGFDNGFNNIFDNGFDNSFNTGSMTGEARPGRTEPTGR